MNAIGEALLTARRASGMTQQEVAEAADITQAALSRYENDMREPSPEVVAALARVLGVTPQLLARGGRMKGAMAVDAHMRRRATAPPGVWKKLEARLNMLRLHSSHLLEEVTVHSEQSVPRFDPVEIDAAAAARMVRMQWGLPSGPVRRLVEWVEAAGCLVVEEDFETSRVDGLSQWVGGHPVILLNSASPTDRRRLTLAHEVGHLCLHSNEVTDDVEGDANAFAAEFLMPSETIRPLLRNLTDGRLHDLKRQWGVSMQALIERAFDLGQIDARQRTNFYKRFSARGWRKREPLSDELAPEQPTLTARIGASLLERGLSEIDIAHLAGFAEPDHLNPFQPVTSRLRIV